MDKNINFEEELHNWKQLLLDVFDGNFTLNYLKEYDITIIKNLDYKIVKNCKKFKETIYGNTYVSGKFTYTDFSDFIVSRMKILKYLIDN